MPDILGKMMNYCLFAVVTIMIVILFLGKVDSAMESYVRDESISFANECQTTGYINPENFENFVALITKLGSYNVKISHGAKRAYAVFDGGDATGEYEEHYEYTNLDTILEYMYPEQHGIEKERNYTMKTGDEFTITVTRHSSLFTGGFAWLTGGTGMPDSVVCKYSGRVGNSPV